MQLSLKFLMLLLLFRQLKSNRFQFDYHLLNVGPHTTTIGWNYTDQGCTAVRYSLRAFTLTQVTSGQLNSPLVEIISPTATFSFPTREFADETLYFNVSGINAEGRVCEANGDYFNFDNLFENDNGSACHFLTPQMTSICITPPSTSQVPFFVWPKGLQTQDGYCYCHIYPDLFNACTSGCPSIYQFTFRANPDRVCLTVNTMVLQATRPFKVYIIIDNDPCRTQCIITTLISSHLIAREEFCSQHAATQQQILFYPSQNFTATLNENEDTFLHINVTYEPNATYQEVSWRHNGFAINSVRNPRIHIANDGGITVNGIEPTDAGAYAVIACNQRGCESARFSVFVNYLTLTEARSFSLTEENTLVYSCSAVGYPNAQLMWWRTGLGQPISDGHFNSTLQQDMNRQNITVSNLSVQDQEACRMSRGYICTFNNSGLPSIMRSATLHCPPGPPGDITVSYTSTNNSTVICFDAYTHPDYPVELYRLITTNSTVVTFTQDYMVTRHSSNNLHCANLTLRQCGSLQVSVLAENQLGNLTSIENFQDLPCHNESSEIGLIQLHLKGVSNCTKWRMLETMTKLMAISEVLAEAISEDCSCSYPVSHIYEVNFYCFPDNPNDVIFRGHTEVYLNLTVSQLINIIDHWVTSQTSIEVQGLLLYLDDEYPVVTTNFKDPNSSINPETDLNLVLISGVSGGALFLLIAISVLTVVFLRKCFISKKKTLQSAALEMEATMYEEIPEATACSESKHQLQEPVYEEITPKTNNKDMISCSVCEAYAVSKNLLPIAERNVVWHEDTRTITRPDDMYHFTQCSAYTLT